MRRVSRGCEARFLSWIVGLLFVAAWLTGCDATRPYGASQDHGPTVAVDDSSFEQVVLQADVPVLVDFYADWCGPCQSMAPVIGDLAADFEGRAIVAKLDTDASPKTASLHGIQYLPTLIVFDGGREVSRLVGSKSKGELAAKLDEALAQ